MKILSAKQIRQVDDLTIKLEPIASIDLMERAAIACFNWIICHFDNNFIFNVFTGPGNNGGDGLAIARLLQNSGYKVYVFMIWPPEKLSADALVNYRKFKELNNPGISLIGESENLWEFNKRDVIIDSIFGTGISKPVAGVTADIINVINQSGSVVISIDMPSGLRIPDTVSSENEAIVKANYTLTFQMPKLQFFFKEFQKFTGQWVVLDIGLSAPAIAGENSYYYYTTREDIYNIYKPRNLFANKGNFGHALLIAGSFGKIGAAVLASKSCLRSGAGLLTSFIPAIGYNIMQSTIPEAMVILDKNQDYLTELPDLQMFKAIGIGPGIGKEEKTAMMLNVLLTLYKLPMVIDADALNILAMYPQWLNFLSPEIILTPHPGEFDRLAGVSHNSYQRHLKQIYFSRQFNTIVVLKGAFTSVTTPDGFCRFNSTGNPGMATAGSGDVLTGIILSLLAQGYQPEDAAVMGVYIHGLAGDIAAENTGEEALIASDIINNLGGAFKKLKTYV